MAKIKTPGRTSLEVTWREATCYREMPDFPSHLAPWAATLADGYKDRMIGPGMHCPHQGFSLRGLPVCDDVVVCPGHGLRWNVKTGKAVPRS